MAYDNDEYHDDEYYYEDEDASNPLAQRIANLGFGSSILVIIALTVLYVLFPIDAVPDIIPVAGQADDLVAILAGGGSVAFMTALRHLLSTRAGRWGCAIIGTLSTLGACAVFWALMRLFDTIF